MRVLNERNRRPIYTCTMNPNTVLYIVSSITAVILRCTMDLIIFLKKEILKQL